MKQHSSVKCCDMCFRLACACYLLRLSHHLGFDMLLPEGSFFSFVQELCVRIGKAWPMLLDSAALASVECRRVL